MTITASKVARLMRCPGSGALRQVDSSNRYAERGSAVHRFLEVMMLGDDRGAALAAVPPEYRELCASIDLDKLPKNAEPELALAYDVATGVARRIGSAKHRDYGALGPFEVAMTLDVAGLDNGVAHVCDYKATMRSPGSAAGHDQLRVCALALARLHGVERARTELAHIRPDGSVWIDRDDLDAFDLDEIAEGLRKLHGDVAEQKAKAQRGEPLDLAVGDHCTFCPSRSVCPAQSRLAVELSQGQVFGDPLTMLPLSPERAGIAWDRMKAARALLSHIEDACHAALEEYGELPLPGGRVLRKVVAPGNERLDGKVAHSVIAEKYGRAAADSAVEMKTTKSAIKAALKGAGGGPVAAMERDVLETIRERGGAKRPMSTRIVDVQLSAEQKRRLG